MNTLLNDALWRVTAPSQGLSSWAEAATARAAAGSNAHPTDYLQFFAPGNREAKLPDEVAPAEPALPNSPLALVQETRRHMIYVCPPPSPSLLEATKKHCPGNIGLQLSGPGALNPGAVSPIIVSRARGLCLAARLWPDGRASVTNAAP